MEGPIGNVQQELCDIFAGRDVVGELVALLRVYFLCEVLLPPPLEVDEIDEHVTQLSSTSNCCRSLTA